jgi:hypothetical protein
LAEELHEEFRRWRWREPLQPKTTDLVSLSASAKISFDVPVFPDLAAFTGPLPSGGSQAAESERFHSSWFDDKSFFYLKNENLGFAAPSGAIAIVECDPSPGNDRNLVIAIRGNEVYARRLLRPIKDNGLVSLAAQTPDPRKSPPTMVVEAADIQVHRIVGVLFEGGPPPREKQEAVEISQSPELSKVMTAHRVKDVSALPLALPGQLVLGGDCLNANQLELHEGALVALMLSDGTGLFKRVGPKLPGNLAHLRQFESIGGLGSSEVVAMEMVEGLSGDIPIMVCARKIVGIIYETP